MAELDPPPTLAGLRRARLPTAPGRRQAATQPLPGLFDFPPTPDFDGIPERSPAAVPAPATPPAAREVPLPAMGLPTDPPQSAAPAARETAPQTWTVSALVQHVRGTVERGYGRVTVEGEISNWRPAGSGHCYFTVKDAGAQLSAVLFRRQASLLRFQPRDGDAVKLHGQLSVFESRGQMQLIVEWMQQAGLGALLAEVQRLKEALRREGLFDRKRPLPPFPRCIGVVTSLQGAALRDIVKVCRRRHAAVRLLIYPAAVQGPHCPGEIAAALRWFNAHPDEAEVVLVARGGGSWEDLHGFDHEQVARAIAGCCLPVITGIGHATDSTVADAAADACAPTPSAAAELLTAAQHRVEERVARLEDRLLRAGRYQLLHAQGRFGRLGSPVVLSRAQDSLDRRGQRLDELQFRSHNALQHRLRLCANRFKTLEGRLARLNPAVRLQGDRRRLEILGSRLHHAGKAALGTATRRLEGTTTHLDALSPLRVLDRGYALVYGPEGHLLRNVAAVVPGEPITARLAHGSVQAQVLAVAPPPTAL